ncbi:MAG TPA: ornithine cyclodeaminase family protein [Candidatus Saccharimonadales bacterium]|jgi:ornithine cyclodeaminase/alanine dehydrogenase-like protein (mu-crystallin family)|nr:ornithine cyclodeaminase family protein [Candidatus Saccharimonadales bacterium]
MTVRLLRAADLAMACPMADAISAVADGFTALSAGQATVPVRLSVPLPPDGTVLTMPAALAGASCYSVKVVSVAPRNALAGRPVVMGTVLLGDSATGELLAIIDGTALTALRTGAAGGVAARALSRSGASRVALFGAGAQARAQLTALACVRTITDVRVVTRDPAHSAALCRWAAGQPGLATIAIRAASPKDAVALADVVVTATTSATPVFEGGWLRSGVHVTAVGSFTPRMRELDEVTLNAARLVVDQRAAALAEAGELQGRGDGDIVEIGEILSGRQPGRADDAQRTVFKSVGNAVQDLVVAARAYERARAKGIGEELAFP